MNNVISLVTNHVARTLHACILDDLTILQNIWHAIAQAILFVFLVLKVTKADNPPHGTTIYKDTKP
jgi:hypothetical protein